MKAIIFFISVLISAFSFAGQNVKCELQYFGDSDKFKVTEFSFMGMPSDSYLYTCADCGGIQINVFPSGQSVASYSFENDIDFERKINTEYNRKDIAKLEMENVSQGGRIKYSIIETGLAEFYPMGKKISYLHFLAKQHNGKEQVGYSGFVTSNGEKSCSIIATYLGKEISSQGSKSLSYFMNHISM
ncbi:TPA: hypothetical protein G8L55_001931 [Salmonella enterica]|uniref:Uncharacterized protein n=1 Tax=Salmonella enterica TaxID=28901 RepID=A0A742P350_SALER|nr:hypothetical protein [Salmonella enterica subsp. enterica serovar Corvallis]ECN6752984.1 hypothetical protein [Salmonella enterica subsp. enterica serovar Newport]EHW4465840.1 hypothetical protein [Salmonella enterica subsp. enterica serovar Kottbus]EKU3953214.1 hypothetical protein [Citrobacter freundii]HAF1516946.1 hypothetical protein [Salmonella enterica]